MFARVNYVRFKPDRIEEVIERWPAAVASYRGAGFERGYLLLDRASGQSVSVIFFAAEADMMANETGGTLKQAVAQFDDLRLSEPDKHCYEVAGTIVPASPGEITHARVLQPTAKLEHLDTVIAGWHDLVPSYRQEAGFRCADLLVDRQTGKLLALTVWRSEADIRVNEDSGAMNATVEPYKEMLAVPPSKAYYEVAAVVERDEAAAP